MEAIKITYDNVGNTLDIWFTKPSKNIIKNELVRIYPVGLLGNPDLRAQGFAIPFHK